MNDPGDDPDPARAGGLTPPARPSCSAAGVRSATFSLVDYDLAETLVSGQSFRWRFENDAWTGVIGNCWVRLQSSPTALAAETAVPVPDWDWLRNYLQLDAAFAHVVGTFPDDGPMRAAVRSCHGLRLLRQDPWECLASFILSSTKQIVQIRQIVALLCERFGERIPVLPGYSAAYSFPTATRLAHVSEAGLRACKMGFRAPYLLETAQEIASGRFDLESLRHADLSAARAALIGLPGVGRKIADCVLLFAYGYPTAFPVDVWVMKAFRALYFRNRRVAPKRLRHFSETHFGPNAGYAQQYLFHYIRTKLK